MNTQYGNIIYSSENWRLFDEIRSLVDIDLLTNFGEASQSFCSAHSNDIGFRGFRGAFRTILRISIYIGFRGQGAYKTILRDSQMDFLGYIVSPLLSVKISSQDRPKDAKSALE